VENMKSIVLLCIILFSQNAAAEEPPVIRLHEGKNEIVMSIKNNWAQDRVKLNTIIDRNDLPHWLKVSGNETVKSDGKGTYKFVLDFFIEDSPLYLMEEVPLKIKDDAGNRWDFTFMVDVVDDSSPVLLNSLYDNYPNPFNPTTTIKYSLESNIRTQLIVFNSIGQTVRILVDEVQSSGVHSIQWDSNDDQGLRVPSGIYFYKLKTGKFEKMKKMILLK